MIRAPSRGDALLASWGASVAEGVNALAPMASPGSLARQGVSGTGAQALPQNRRDRKATAAGAAPDVFRVRASVETKTDGDATKKRLVVDFLSSDEYMVTWNDIAIGSLGVETGEGLSPAVDCNIGFLGWQRIHEGEWEDADGFVGDIEVWLRLCLEFRPCTDDLGPAESSNTGWSLRASAGDDTTYCLLGSEGEAGTRQLIRYYRVAKVVGGNVACQDLLGGLHFVEMYPDGGGGGGGSGLTDDDLEPLRKNSAFGLATEKDEDGNVTGRTISNFVWRVGGRTRRQSGSASIGTGNGVFCAKFSADAFASCEIISTTWDALSALESDEASYVVPLYEISDGTVVDLRTAPQVQAFEEALT